MTLKLTLPLPPPLNSLYRISNKRLYKAPEASIWLREVQSYLMMNKIEYRGIFETNKGGSAAKLRATFRMFLKRERDCDSSLKLTLDVLETLGVYENDRQVYEIHVYKEFDKSNPRLEVEIEDMK